MRKALVDNATLTALQRLSGDILVKNKYDLDGDILAMESLLQAILFFDEVYYLDDYKSEFKQNRHEHFSGLQPIQIDEETQNIFSQETLQQVQSIVPHVTAGSFTDGDFRPFFDMLKMNIWYVWNIQSSVFYLTQKLLADASGVEINKYSALSAMIFSELKDNTQRDEIPDKRPVLLGSDGNPITSQDKITKQVTTFFAGLNWLAYRSIYYTIISNQFGLDLFLHPIRQAFQVNYLRKTCLPGSLQFRPLIDALTNTTTNTMAQIYCAINPSISSYPIPIFSAYISSKSLHTGINALDIAYHIREENMFVEARRQLDTLEQLYIDGREKKFLREVNQLQRDLFNQMRRIREKYNVSTPQGSLVTNMISFWDTSCLLTGLPNLGGDTGIANIISLIHDIRPRGGFAAVYKSILSDLTNIQMLGHFHELITRNVHYDREAQYHPIKVQDPAYKKAHSWWSMPM
ncbi:hypothetical protein OXPF_35900 [Oxobacter pfennigii]|uniref:Uncharacterized protein n=1 Tax=Oxobacter pfennigii TaxID=36849 RepID=A0A0P8W2S1_9CLOT|nr:hypothetical protein [Oxobacter pfennigii]KPU42827.1 hypothetical protein OXPF_35900 [Oxobacter pfennigii]